MTTFLTPEMIKSWDANSRMHVQAVVLDAVKFIKRCNLETVTVLDIGSNVGKFIELLLDHVAISDAILVEPVTMFLEYSKQKFPHFRFENRLVSDKTEMLALYTPKNSENLGLSRILAQPDGASPDDIQYMEAVSIEDLLTIDHPGFTPDIIKVDAEGHDIQIVIGLVGHLSRETGWRPLIIFECNGGADVSEVYRQYEEIGYANWSRLPEYSSRDIILYPSGIFN